MSMPGPAIYGALGYGNRLRRKTWNRYLVGAALALAAGGVRWVSCSVLDGHLPWLFFFPAVVLAALYGGFGTGLFTAAISISLTMWWWMPAYYSSSVHWPER